MERKIGEIFEYNGEWYQCVRSILTCSTCEIPRPCTKIRELGSCFPDIRNDKEQVIFKKLEKVGEPFFFDKGKLFQKYKVFDIDNAKTHSNVNVFLPIDNIKIVLIEIKQNQEEMKEKNLNLKPFDLEAAKAGKPVCTRDGRNARIICFDRMNGDYYKIVACVTAFDGDFEEVLFYGIDGYIVDSQNPKDEDLMMLPEKKEGWAKVRKDINLYDTKEEADRKMIGNDEYVTAKVCWEE